jgi:hypothetical protein
MSVRALLLALVLWLPLAAGAATVTPEVNTADTGATPNTSGAFTPATDDLLVVAVCATGTADVTAALTSSVGGFTFTQVEYVTYAGDTAGLFLYVSDALVSDTSSQTVTWTEAADPALGTNIMVAAIAGIELDGLDAIVQTAEEGNQADSSIPETIFAGAAATGNPTLGFACNGLSPANITEPSGWTEGGDIGHASPDHGAEWAYRNSGFTGTTITWQTEYGSAGSIQTAAMSVEIDATASGGTPTQVSFVAASFDDDTADTSVTPAEPTDTAEDDLVVGPTLRTSQRSTRSTRRSASPTRSCTSAIRSAAQAREADTRSPIADPRRA